MTYILPFSYFLRTRLLKGSVAFHLIFEWAAAAALVVLWGRFGIATSLLWSLASYLAFISLYEIGYMVNDLFMARKEDGGRLRGPQDASPALIYLWIGVRIAVFLAVTVVLGVMAYPRWWSFFVGLCIVFALHNALADKEKKFATFLWLGWFRFMAPVIFVLREDQVMGVAFATALTYVAFRSLSYLDSKDLLAMPGRQRPDFQRFFFLIALAGGLALLSFSQAQAGIGLMVFFALASLVGTLPRRWRRAVHSQDRDPC